jgi:large subunit ribosomal protein L4
VFGPHPRDYSKKVNKTTKRIALLKVLSERIKSEDILLVGVFSVAEPKTKQFLTALQTITSEPKTLIVSRSFDKNTYRAARNVKPTLLMTAAEVNAEHILKFKKIIMTDDALEDLSQRISKK